MKLALVLIDVQNDYFPPEGRRPLPDAHAALPNIHRLLAAARAKGIHVIHVVTEKLDPGGDAFVHGTTGQQMHPSIEPQADEEVVLKHFPGSFTQTALEAYVRRSGADTLIICGYQTQMCCDTTTRQARERGFKVWFASDATASRDMQLGDTVIPHRQVHETVLAIMSTMFGAWVATTDRIIAAMDR